MKNRKKRSNVRTAFNIAVSRNYDQEVNPQDYEKYVLGRFKRRDILAHDIGNVLEQYVPIQNQEGQPSTVLDVAAGTGIVSRDLAARGYNVIAVDLSQKALDYLHTQSPSIRTQVVDMNARLPFDDNSFEGITTVWANRYIADTAKFLEEMQRVLKPEGVFVWPVFPMERPFWKMNAGLKQTTSTRSLEQQAREHGFGEISVINNPVYANMLRKDARMYATPSFVIARK